MIFGGSVDADGRRRANDPGFSDAKPISNDDEEAHQLDVAAETPP